jgi:hypothetical protein
MVLGMSTFTFVHVLISLVGIGTGLIVAYGLLTAQRLEGWTACFLVTTVATSVSGFFFPFHGFTPAIGVGILSMIVLIAAIVALYVFHLAGVWRWIYVGGAVIALYFNVFVLIVQAFQKIAPLKALAPTQTEPPFVVVQIAALLFFVGVGVASIRRFHPPVSA